MTISGDNSLRVVFLSPVGVLGGAELSLLDLMSALGEARPNLERHLIACSAGPLIQRAEALGVQVHVLSLPAELATLGDSSSHSAVAALGLVALAARASWKTYRYTSALRHLLKALKPDIIHSNGIKTHCLLAVAKPVSVPVVWHVRDFLGSRRIASKVLRLAGRRVAGAIAISDAVRQDAVKVVGPRLTIETIYNAVDVGLFAPGEGDGGELDRLAGLSASAVVRIGLIATYARWKGQLLFLEAAALLAARRPDLSLRYFVIGGPIYGTVGSQFSAAELSSKIDTLGLAKSVGLIPFQSDPAPIYRHLDIVVHASTQPEPFGRTIVEAMACGRPVIVSRAGGAIELFTEGLDAISFDSGDAEQLSLSMEMLSTDPARRTRLAEAARATATARFSRARLGSEILGVYDRVLTQPRS